MRSPIMLSGFLVRRGILFLMMALCLFSLSAGTAEGKVYIDITSPAVRKLPIAIFDLQGDSGAEIAEVIRQDLIFSGFFMYIDKTSYVEEASQPFDPQNWVPLGIEAVLKGQVEVNGDLVVTITLYDTFENKVVLRKQYQSQKELLRPLAHSISNDIYTSFTGEEGIFRTKIAFVGEEEGDKSIYIMDYDGGRVKKLGLRGDLVLTPHWTQDGTTIIYSSERGRQWGIYMLDFTKMTEQRVFSAPGVNIAGDFFPDGGRFVFSSTKEGTPDLFRMDIRGGKTTRLTSSYGIEVSPAVSHDGKSIAFVSDRGGSPQIYLMGSDGSSVRRVTYDGSYNTSPSWSPLGDRIVFSGRRGGKNQVFTVRPDGEGLMQLTDRGNNEDPSFSPDGRYITFMSDRDGRKGVYIMRSNGEAQKKITPRGLRAYGPRWAPK